MSVTSVSFWYRYKHHSHQHNHYHHHHYSPRCHHHSFIYSFILGTYIAPLQDTTTQRRSQPSHGPVTAKEEGLEGDVKFGRGGHQQGTQLNREIILSGWAHNRKGPSLSLSS